MGPVHRGQLFVASCFALIATAVCFAVVGDIMGDLKSRFVLSNEQVGYIGGAAIWGFTIAMAAFGSFVDVLGMRNLLFFALLCHLAGALTMMFGANFVTLFSGALILALGNGTVEAVCNPLIATLFPDRKTEKLNQFHVWFPGGIVIGAVGAYLLGQAQLTTLGPLVLWQVKLCLIIVPALIYGVLIAGQTFPATERVQAGMTFGQMVAGALGRPLLWILLICMAVTASLELGPGRWIPSVLTAGGISGILVLAYGNGLMAVLRFLAGPVVHKLSPTGILVLSAILSGVGLYWFSFAENTAMAFASATVFYVGVCYFWPTMLGVTAERVPRSGSLGLALMGGMGMLAVGVLTAPQMGAVADKFLLERLNQNPQVTVGVLQQVVAEYPAAAAKEPEQFRKEIDGAVTESSKVLAAFESTKALPATTADALRNAAKNHPSGDTVKPIVTKINETLNPADNFGGRMSFRYVAPFSLLIIVVFGILFLRDRAAGGYKAETLQGASTE